MTVRYGQLTYTSMDGPSIHGGWQVKETSGDITNDEATLLVSQIHLSLNMFEQLPRYPTVDDLRMAPRRLLHRRIDQHTAAYFHYAPAGTDGSGRPGNVFVHVLLDRDASATGAFRPVELWRSRQWLTPYGGRAVAEAFLAADPPAASGVVTPSSVINFACDSETWRLSTLCGLMDGVLSALDGGTTVLLGVRSSDHAAQWVGALSFLMSPSTTRRFNFSICECSVDRDYLLTAGLHLVTIPNAAVDAVPPGVVFIDENKTLSLGELGGEPHRTGDGQQIDATAWSAMAQVVLVGPNSGARLLADIDEYSCKIGDVDLSPPVPMAFSVLNNAEWADAAVEARMILAAVAPQHHAPAANTMAQLQWRR